MKLLIKKKYFDQIKRNDKTIEYRDAHITFVCEETKEELRKDVKDAMVIYKPVGYDDVLQDKKTIAFVLKNI
ncbi:MAG: hypothetical protein IH934_04830 [Nanoarchaeota archaeon]|nr:hypothetical protein [Nanoarchaeota archaeon]